MMLNETKGRTECNVNVMQIYVQLLAHYSFIFPENTGRRPCPNSTTFVRYRKLKNHVGVI